MDRRRFIINNTWLASTLLTAFNVSATPQTIHTKVRHSATQVFSKSDWLTIAIVQNHLLPSEQSAPGAVEINALHYLHSYLSNPSTDPIEVKFIHSGVQKLQKWVQKESASGQALLADQSIEQREITLRQFEKSSDGRRWLVTLLNYVLEALLTDPIYGGNPNGIGWQWLEHRSGDPHPPMNKRYWLL